MKYLGEATYILGIRICGDIYQRFISLSQSIYLDKKFISFNIHDSYKGSMPMSHGVCMSKEQSLSTKKEKDYMNNTPYAYEIVSILYSILCLRQMYCIL